jgi:hypothetical protein
MTDDRRAFATSAFRPPVRALRTYFALVSRRRRRVDRDREISAASSARARNPCDRGCG